MVSSTAHSISRLRMAGAMQPTMRKPLRSLGPKPSAQLRDRLIAEVHELGSSDDAATWAHKSLADKNKLTAADAQAVEDAFQAKLEALGRGGGHHLRRPKAAWRLPDAR